MRGRTWSGGGGNRERRGGRESNSYFVKTFVFSEKEPVQFMWAAAELRVLQLGLLLLCECAALCHRMWGLGSHSFSQEEGLFLAFYAHKDKKGLGQTRSSLKSSGIWEQCQHVRTRNDLCDFVPTNYIQSGIFSHSLFFPHSCVTRLVSWTCMKKVISPH